MRERAQRFDPRQNMISQTFEIFHYREPKPNDVEVHHHDFYEVYFFLGTEGEYWVDGRKQRLQSGDLLLINPMELHKPIVKHDSSVYERIVLWINKDYLESLSHELSLTRCFDSDLPTHSNLLRPTAAQRAQLITRLGELVRECYSGDYGSRLCASGIFLQFMVELNRISLNYGTVSEEHGESSPLVSKVLAYINEHYSEELTLELLAHKFFVSKYHLSHEFSRTVGISVYKYIMLKRLLMAKQQLSTGASPGEVYAVCGFTDYANFYRAFKAEYGVSPKMCVGDSTR